MNGSVYTVQLKAPCTRATLALPQQAWTCQAASELDVHAAWQAARANRCILLPVYPEDRRRFSKRSATISKIPCRFFEKSNVLDQSATDLPRHFRILLSVILLNWQQASDGRKEPGGSVDGERANFTILILGCLEADFCNLCIFVEKREALAEIYTMHSILQLSNLKFLSKFV